MIEMEIIAYCAAFLKSGAFLPQAFTVLKTRKTDGLSLITYTALVLGIGMWVVYGIINQIWPLAIASSVSFSLSLTIFLVMVKNRMPRLRAFHRLKARSKTLA